MRRNEETNMCLCPFEGCGMEFGSEKELRHHWDIDCALFPMVCDISGFRVSRGQVNAFDYRSAMVGEVVNLRSQIAQQKNQA